LQMMKDQAFEAVVSMLRRKTKTELEALSNAWKFLKYFTPDEVYAWLFTADCFRPEAARDLAEMGYTPDTASRVLAEDVGLGWYKGTVGHKYANGDVRKEFARSLAR